MSTPDATDYKAIIESLQQKLAELTVQVQGQAAPEPAGPATQSGSVEALAFVEAMETAIASKSYGDALAASDALIALVKLLTR